MRRISGRGQYLFTAIALAGALWSAAVHAQTLVHFDLPAQSLAKSLNAIGTATNTDVGFNAGEVAGLVAPPLKADLTLDDALARVLAGTGLRPRHLNDHTIVIAAGEPSASDFAQKKSLPTKVSAPALAEDPLARQQDPGQSDMMDSSPSLDMQKKDLAEIVVTGTHIAGEVPVGSALITISAADISNSGYLTIGDVVRSLPQSFAGASTPAWSGRVAH